MAEDIAARARAIIEANAYMTLATADGEGLPWATPVWYAPESDISLLWISRPGARHSVNLARRAELGIAIFDSRQPPGTGEGVYMQATAEEVADDELERAVTVFSERSLRHGDGPVGRDDVRAPAEHRLYRATAYEVFILGDRDQRIAVDLG
jgi:nitroimidazol reductase NimA-like FMN-containing flavoprotein (pyridoxamine 5'-phosphate oxidase superfamily)